MDSTQGPINSLTMEQAAAMAAGMGYPQMSFLQMLHGVTQSEEEDVKPVHPQFHYESNLRRLLEIQARYDRPKPAKVEPYLLPVEQQLESCVTLASPTAELRPPAEAVADVGCAKERKKRKRSRAPPPPSTKNAQEVENQRMNHIAVERNRRRLMNSYLVTLRSLMPQSFVQRPDQASIIAGAIDFIKELEQLLLSLQAKKRMRAGGDPTATATSSCSASSSCTIADADEGYHAPPSPLVSDFLISPQYTGFSDGSGGVDVEATAVQGHVNLKVVGRRRRGQLLRAVAALEEVGLTVLHLNVATLDATAILYSLNLKAEDECKLGSADEIAAAVHQIFSYLSACCD